MSWVRIEDRIVFHRKIANAGNEAVGAWVRMIAWSSAHEHDGMVPAVIAKSIIGVTRFKKIMPKLLATGLMEPAEGDFLIHDYHHYNPSSDQKRESRSKTLNARTEAGRRGGIASGLARSNDLAKQTRSKREANEEANTQAKRTPDPDPVSSSLREEDSAPALPGLNLNVQDGPKHGDPSRKDAIECLVYYKTRWVEIMQPADGRPPTVAEADWGNLGRLVKQHGKDRVIGFIDRYLADDHPGALSNGHALRNLPARVNAYRVGKVPQKKTEHSRPMLKTWEETQAEQKAARERLEREHEEKGT